jgi:DNA invertase Pin-like site-specific DNA recombinase
MSESIKVQPHHLNRGAYLYVRQSTLRQVMENVESTKRQYALRGRAVALGWPEERIVIIDSDQGESGASAAWREGFQRLVAEVGMGRAGIVMGLEVSRLARNNADWHRLLEICALAETLILDEDGVYDPANFNDRMLLGLKGTMSEAELHILKSRLRGGVLNKVRQGEYRCLLPTGLVYDDGGNVVLDPDIKVRETITHLFQTFLRVGSAHQSVKAFRDEGLLFPSCIQRNAGGTIVFQPLTASTVMRVLHNPRYAGAYAYGRRRYQRTVKGKHTHRKHDYNDWLACILNAHPGYITWEQNQHNLRILEVNGQGYQIARQSPPREGPALLQGRAICGKCGSHFRVRYVTRRGGSESWYVCDHGSAARGEPNCQSIAGGPIDHAIGILVAERMTPEAVELAFEVQKEIETRQEETDRLRCRAIERAQFEADLAQRRFMMVDPSNRLVADTLEADWNNKLRVLAKAREERLQHKHVNDVALSQAIRERLALMTKDFKLLWSDAATSSRERKRMLAHIVEDVTLVKAQKEGYTKIHVRFKGGKTETLTAKNPLSSAQQIKTATETVELIDKLLDDYTYPEIAEKLNERGLRPGGAARPGRANDRFCEKRVGFIVHEYGLRLRYDRLRKRGMLTRREIAARLGIHEATVEPWVEFGLIKRYAYNGRAYLYQDPGDNPPIKHSSRWDRLAHRAAAIMAKV